MAYDDILKQVPIGDIAKRLGVAPDVAKSAVEQGGAVLLSGLARNASSPDGSAAIEKALKKHQGPKTSMSVDDIDQADGGKIVTHILGPDEKKVTEKLTTSDKTAGIDFGKLLPILAPIIMNLIADANKGRSGGTGGGQGGIGDLIGGILGGSSGTGGRPGGIDLGSVLGGLFGGKK
ncbi:DUF937 domain-containing protein [Microbacterium sp. 179-I 3D4 NHS]|uniref:DUF937 domain-containing protein n=1 Tax=Microbacterium sp. 179-I 3D4 NHS TaxID=3142381 RepID=UPI0039A225FF